MITGPRAFHIRIVTLLLFVALPLAADNEEKLVKQTSTFTNEPEPVSNSESESSDTITAETRGISSWSSKLDSCKYAEQAAKRKAESACKKKKGINLNFLKTQCFDCRQSTYTNEWYCSSRVVAQCSSFENIKSPSPINKLRGLLQDSNGNPYTEKNNPCTKDANTKACKEYRKAKKAAIGVRG